MVTPRRDRHWAIHPVGIRSDRIWRTVEQPTETFEDAAGEPEHVKPSLPPSDMMRVWQPHNYEHGRSKPSLAPDVVLARMDNVKPEPIVLPKHLAPPLKPYQNPDTFVPPTPPPPPIRSFDRHDPCWEPNCDDPMYCVGHRLEQPNLEEQVEDDFRRRKVKRTKKKKKQSAPAPVLCSSCGIMPVGAAGLCAQCLQDKLLEADDLKRRLEALERATLAPTVLPVFVQPFVCSSCDQSSPMFDRAHSRCTRGECACYDQTPDQHDATRRSP